MPLATIDPVDRESSPAQPPPPEPPWDDDDEGDSGAGDEWVTVATFWQALDAQMARLKLEFEGIDCVLLDENLVATDWLYANAVGGIKVQVPVGALEQARLALTRESPAADALPPHAATTQFCPIAMFQDAAEAQLAVTALEGQDIDSHVRTDAPAGDTDDPFERYRLMVDSRDVERAVEYLRSTPARSKLIESDDEEADAPLAYAPRFEQCPACGSSNVHRRYATRRSAALAILLLGFPIPFLTRLWTCDECGHDWK